MVTRHGVQDVQGEDQEIGEEDDNTHTLLSGLLHIRNDRNELDLRAMTKTEDGKNDKEVLIKDEALNLQSIKQTNNQ